MKLRRATSDDIPAIMAIERQPGHEQFVGQWSAEQHAQQLGDAAFHYFVAEDEGCRNCREGRALGDLDQSQ